MPKIGKIRLKYDDDFDKDHDIYYSSKEESPLKESQTFYDQVDHIISITRGIVEGIDNIQIFKNRYNDR